MSSSPFDAIKVIEVLAHARRSNEAFDRVVDLLLDLQARWHGRSTSIEGYTGSPGPVFGGLCERVAAVWATILLDEGLDPSRVRLAELLRNLHVLHELVHGTQEGNLDGALGVLETRAGGKYTQVTLLKVILLWVPGSRVNLDFPRFHAHLPEPVVAAAIATVGGLVMSTPDAHRARESAIAFLNSGVPRAADHRRLGISRALLAAWMFCSYATAPDRHRVKRFLNEVVEQSLPAPVPCAAPRPVDGKPVMVLPLEGFNSRHAMFRCYGPVIAALRPHFHLVGLALAGDVDPVARALFDVFHEVPTGELDIAQLAETVRSHAPALLFYPSIGMRMHTLLLANMRLAPRQAMTYGHPATSESKHIDAGFTEQQWIIDPAQFSERMVPLPPGTLRYTLHPERAAVPRPASAPGGVLRVAIPSFAQKWTRPFLEVLARARARAGMGIEFHFFAGVDGYTFPSAVNAVLRALPTAIVHPTLAYPDYLAALARCDLHLATFPFGGTNSVFDSLTCGLPIACLAPSAIHGAQEADFIARAGLPDWLVAPDEDALVDLLVRLAREPDTLARLRAPLADTERVARIFVEGGAPEVFARALVDFNAGTLAGQAAS